MQSKRASVRRSTGLWQWCQIALRAVYGQQNARTRNTHTQITTSKFVEFADNYFFLTFFNLNLIVSQLTDERPNEQRVLLVEQSTTQRQIAIIGERMSRTGSSRTLRNLAGGKLMVCVCSEVCVLAVTAVQCQNTLSQQSAPDTSTFLPDLVSRSIANS